MLGNYIKKLRKESGFSQDYMAEKIGLSRPTYAQVEEGEKSLTIEEATKLAFVFGMTFEDFLNKREKKVKVSLEKVKEAKNKDNEIRINVPQRNIKKFKQILLYLLEKVGSKPNVGMTVLYKLLYFIDFDYYEKYEEQLMGLTYFKNHHGPAPREFAKIIEDMKKNEELEEVKSKFHKYDQKKFLPLKKSDLDSLTARELKMIDSVIVRYGDKTATELSKISHEDMPWSAAKEGANLKYDHVFYRPDHLSVREYEEL